MPGVVVSHNEKLINFSFSVGHKIQANMGTIMSIVSSILISCVKNRDPGFNRAAVFSFSLAEIVKPIRIKREKTISQIVCFIIFFPR